MTQKTMTAEEAKAFARNLFDEGLKQLAQAEATYKQLVEQIPRDPALRRDRWLVQAHLHPQWDFHSQDGQDRFIYEQFFQSAKGGFFVDVGAYDGVASSNTLFFERSLGWRGLCIEASPTQFAKLSSNRRNPCLNFAIGDRHAEEQFLEVTSGYTQMSGLLSELAGAEIVLGNPHHKGQEISVPVQPLSAILDEQRVPSSIDYCSIDVEGAEMRVLKGIDFERHQIGVFSIENGSHYQHDPNTDVKEFMEAHGYRHVDTVGLDEIFTRH